MKKSGNCYTYGNQESGPAESIYKDAISGDFLYQPSCQPPPLSRSIPGASTEEYEMVCTRKPTTAEAQTLDFSSTKQVVDPKRSKKSKIATKYIVFGFLLAVSLAAVLVETSILLWNQKTLLSHFDDRETPADTDTNLPDTTITSCLDLKRRNSYARSGIYNISTPGGDLEYSVYCDMESDGGGWTLVAGVHEDNITSKCDSNDRWSTYATGASSNHSGGSAWENRLTFGNLGQATSDDYKNHGYFAIKANDVMIWHVPDDTPVEIARQNAKLRYRTIDKFLRDVGGNLYSLFVDYYHLAVKDYYTDIAESGMLKRARKVLETLEKNNATLKSYVPDWYHYELDYNRYSLDSIYSDMYGYGKHGNQISDIRYGYPYYDAHEWNTSYNVDQWFSNISTLAKTSHPFMMVRVIGIVNQPQYFDMFFHTQVTSQQNTKSTYSFEENEIKMANYKSTYKSAHYTAADTATSCEFYFIIHNIKEWRSVENPFGFDIWASTSNSSRVTTLFTYYQILTNNAVMGYMLLSREKGLNITKDMLDNVARTVLSTIATIDDLFNEYGGSDGLSVPVIFDEGDAERTLNMIPEVFRSRVRPGYMQFRAYNQAGYANALCPGIKMDTYFSEYACLGGISNNADVIGGTCGDFAGWSGKDGTLQDTEKDEYAHSRDDINSTILIFYR